MVSFLADAIERLVGSNLGLTMLAVTWRSAALSTVVCNIPFTAAMLPVVGFLTRTTPGASNLVLFYGLSVGAAVGGNSSLIGASANMVTAGITERAGYPIGYMRFLKVKLPATMITVAMSTIWLLIRF